MPSPQFSLMRRYRTSAALAEAMRGDAALRREVESEVEALTAGGTRAPVNRCAVSRDYALFLRLAVGEES